MGLNFCCDVMYEDKKVGRLEIKDTKLIKNEVYTNNIIEHPFPRSTKLIDILTILSERVICKERFTPELSEMTGIPEYNVYDILRNTHGADVDDAIWFRFDGEPIEWKDINPRKSRRHRHESSVYIDRQ